MGSGRGSRQRKRSVMPYDAIGTGTERDYEEVDLANGRNNIRARTMRAVSEKETRTRHCTHAPEKSDGDCKANLKCAQGLGVKRTMRKMKMLTRLERQTANGNRSIAFVESMRGTRSVDMCV